MQDLALLGHIDLLAAEHGVDALAQSAHCGELEQQGQRLVGDVMLGVVEVEAHRLERESLAAFWVVGEELAQMHARDLLVGRARRLLCAARGGGGWGWGQGRPRGGWAGVGPAAPAATRVRFETLANAGSG